MHMANTRKMNIVNELFALKPTQKFIVAKEFSSRRLARVLLCSLPPLIHNQEEPFFL